LDIDGLKWPDDSGAEAGGCRLNRSRIRKRIDMLQLFDFGNGLFDIHAASNMGISLTKYGRVING
jgi:hypothetical protein